MNIWQRRNGSQKTTMNISRGSIKQIQKYIHLVNQSRRCIRRHHVGGGVSSPTMGRPWELAGLRVEFVREHPLPPSSLPLSPFSPRRLLQLQPRAGPRARARLRLRRTPPPPSAHAARRTPRFGRPAPAGGCSEPWQWLMSAENFSERAPTPKTPPSTTTRPNPKHCREREGIETDRSGAVAVGPPELGCVVRRQTARRRTKDRLKRGRACAVGRK